MKPELLKQLNEREQRLVKAAEGSLFLIGDRSIVTNEDYDAKISAELEIELLTSLAGARRDYYEILEDIGGVIVERDKLRAELDDVQLTMNALYDEHFDGGTRHKPEPVSDLACQLANFVQSCLEGKDGR